MNRLFCMGMAGALWLVATSVGAETLAMTVKYDYGDPSGGSSHWTAEYYTDDQGRLVRTVRSSRGEFVGDPDVKSEVNFVWDATGVSWSEGGTDRSTVSWTPTGVRFTRGQYTSESRILSEEPEFRWEDEKHTYSWATSRGFWMTTKASAPGSAVGYSTQGSRLSRLVGDNVTDFVLLDQRPGTLVANIYGNFLEENGWVQTGSVTIHGRGLGHSDPRVRLAHAEFFFQDLWFPLWASIVLENSAKP